MSEITPWISELLGVKLFKDCSTLAGHDFFSWRKGIPAYFLHPWQSNLSLVSGNSGELSHHAVSYVTRFSELNTKVEKLDCLVAKLLWKFYVASVDMSCNTML